MRTLPLAAVVAAALAATTVPAGAENDPPAGPNAQIEAGSARVETVREAAAIWAPAVTLADEYPGSMEVAAAGDTTIVTWGDWAVSVRRRVGGAWEPVHILAERRGYSPHVATNSSGHSVVAWESANGDMMVAGGEPDGSWSVATRIPTELGPSQWLWESGTAISESGAAAVWWLEVAEPHSGEPRESLHVAYRPAGGDWEAPVTVAGPFPRVRGLGRFVRGDVEMTRGGNVLVAYAVSRPGHKIYMRSRLASRGWLRPRLLSSGHGGLYGAPVLVTNRDSAVVAWQKAKRDGSPVRAIRRGADGWEPRVRLAPPAAEGGNWDIAMGGGLTTIGWSARDQGVAVAEWPDGQRVGPANILSGPVGRRTWRTGPVVEANVTGDTALTWSQFGRDGDGLFAVYRAAGSTWGPVQRVVPASESLSGYFDIAVRSGGEVDAVWDAYSAGGRSLLRYSYLEGR
jgi:hypothetical protein